MVTILWESRSSVTFVHSEMSAVDSPFLVIGEISLLSPASGGFSST